MKRNILLSLMLVLGVAATTTASDEVLPSVVVTTDVLGSVASDLAGEEALVTVLMDGGVDPHSWQPSARDSEAVFGADLVIANGLDLEEGLVDILAQAESDGVAVFHAADHIALLDVEPTDVAESDHEHEADHEHDAADPHFWLDPVAMRDVVIALGPAMAAVGIERVDGVKSIAAELEALDAELVDVLAAVPETDRRLVTGHEALGYFADRYGFEVVGTVVPGLSSSDEPSAREVAQLIEDIRLTGASVIFTDVGTPDGVARAVADETDASVVELSVAVIPDGSDYAGLMRDLASTVAEALMG